MSAPQEMQLYQLERMGDRELPDANPGEARRQA
jgi:hypothetical protein